MPDNERTTHLQWEQLEDDRDIQTQRGVRDKHVSIHRAKVPGGWLVAAVAKYEVKRKFKQLSGDHDYDVDVGSGMGSTFVPDPDHAWDPKDFLGS